MRTVGLNRLSLINLLCFPSVGVTQCETVSARTITDARLTEFDLDRLIPVMISRTIISVKKVASSHQPLHMSAELLDGPPVTLQDACNPHSTEAIQLSVFKKQQV